MADYYLHKTAAHIDELLEKVEGLNNYDDTEVRGLINNKVDKETGKGLSTNDYTTSEKTKLNGIESGAEVNVQADWNQTDTTADNYIKNKPTIPAAQVNADWNATSGVTQILNKPTIYTKNETDTLLVNKVDKETGKGLSTNDFTDAYKTAVDGLDTALDGKVDKETGKGLSTNDYTTSEKTKLNGIESGANVNVQADWNQTNTTADDYIKNKPAIPTVNDATLTIQKNGTAVGTFSANAATAATINITIPVDAEDVNALPDTTKYGASLSLSIDSTTYVVTASLKDQDGNTLGTAQTIDLPLETVVVGGSYDDATKKVILTLKNGNTIDFSVADLVAGLQTEITSTNKLDADLVDDTTSAHKFVTAADKVAWNAKSDFSGDYDDLTNKPALGSAASKNYTTSVTSGLNQLVTSGAVYSAVSAKADKATTYTKTDVDTSQAAQNTRLDRLEQSMNAVLYGYRVDRNDSNPETRVSYMYDAVGMTPARMNYTTGEFDYGSWANAWFIAGNKPVALKFDGTVDYELDPNDYTKKADGTASDVSNASYQGNFMASMPTVYIKRWSDGSYDYYAFSNKQITPVFYADAHDAGDGTINPYIYLPMFKGIIIGGKMRSIAGVTPQGDTSGSEEKTAAEACGSGWQLWDWSKHELISDLLTLISRSTNSQDVFGQGDTKTYNTSDTTTYGRLTTGTSGAGQFWGTSDETHHVKVFHIEDFWGNRWDRCLGLNLVDNQYVYKLVRPYALDTDSSYTSSGLTAPVSGYQKTQYAGRFGTLPKTVDGSSSTYECDDFTVLASGVFLGLFGGFCNHGVRCGSRYLVLGNSSSMSGRNFGGSPCFNPM